MGSQPWSRAPERRRTPRLSCPLQEDQWWERCCTVAGLHRPQPQSRPENLHSPTHLTAVIAKEIVFRDLFIFWSINNCLFKTWKKGHTAAIFSFLFLRCSRLVTDSFLFPFLQPAARQNDFFYFTEFKSKLRMKIKGNVTFAVFSQRQHCRWLHLNSEGCICQSIEESPKCHLKNRRINK